jgi:hypothetical protein
MVIRGPRFRFQKERQPGKQVWVSDAAKQRTKETGGGVMSLGTILIILLILALLGVLPTWGYSNSWGYTPGGIVGLLLVIVIILALLGRI